MSSLKLRRVLDRRLQAGVPAPSHGPRGSPTLWPRVTVIALLVMSVGPSLTWSVLDHSLWTYDQAGYGTFSIDLFHALAASPYTWFRVVFGISDRAPGIAWLGEFFVPLGSFIGSIDIGLLVSIIATQAVTLLLLFLTVRQLTAFRILPSAVACIAVVSAPQFVAEGHEYLVEPLQTLSVAWFVFILTNARTWSIHTLLANLFAACSTALLAKISTPVYVVIPFVVIVFVLYIRRAEVLGQRTRRFSWNLVLCWATVAGLTAATAAWYFRSFRTILDFAVSTTVGPIAGLYTSTPPTLTDRVLFWINGIIGSFFIPTISALTVCVIAVGIIASVWHAKLGPPGYCDAVAAVALLQILATIAAFSEQVLTDWRFLLPLLPYVAVIVGWSVAHVDTSFAVGLLLCFGVQWLVVEAEAFGLVPLSPGVTDWLIPPHPDRADVSDAEALVRSTCFKGQTRETGMTGVETRWFNHNSITYTAAKLQPETGVRCDYTTFPLGERSLANAWNRLMTVDPEYFVSIQPSLYPSSDDRFNTISAGLLRLVEQSEMFKEQPRLPDHPRLLIFRRVAVAAGSTGSRTSDGGTLAEPGRASQLARLF